MGLRLTLAACHGLRAMVYVASRSKEARVVRDEIAREQEIPAAFAAKILRRLVAAGLLRSHRGVNGGFNLARPSAQISLLEIVEALDGPAFVTECASSPENCPLGDHCPAPPVWSSVQAQISHVLGDTDLKQLVAGTAKPPSRATRTG